MLCPQKNREILENWLGVEIGTDYKLTQEIFGDDDGNILKLIVKLNEFTKTIDLNIEID
jgi:hypothetical protein